MSSSLIVGLWLVLFGVLSLVPTEVPKWLIPLAACICGAILIVGGGAWWRTKA